MAGEDGFVVAPWLLQAWRKAYPLAAVDAELRRIWGYACANPAWNRRRRSWRLTIGKWLAGEQGKAAARRSRKPNAGRDGMTYDERVAEYGRRMGEGRRR